MAVKANLIFRREFNLAVNRGIKRVIAAAADVAASQIFRSPLADDYFAGADFLAVVNLNAKPL